MVISGPNNLVEDGKRSEEDVNLKEALGRLSDLVVLQSKKMASLEAKVDSIDSMLQTVLDHIEDNNKASSASGKVRDQMDDLQRFTYDDLKKFTDNFSDQNFIGRTQFCKVYRGKIFEGCNGTAEENVTVKIWADKLQMNREQISESVCADNINRFRDELSFLKNNPHPNLAKLKGSCCEDGKMGVVYELNSFDTLRDLIAEGTLNWLDRIKILVQFALLMEWLHDAGPQYLVRNISAAHIMIDKDLRPILFEFGMLSSWRSTVETEIDRCFYPWGAFGYIDPAIATYGNWSFRVDVFAYGVLIIELLCRRQVDEFYNNVGERFYLMSTYANRVNQAAKSNPGISLSSIVSKKFAKEAEYDKDDAAALMELAVKCASEPESSNQRPTMGQIVHKLKSLNVVQNYVWSFRVDVFAYGVLIIELLCRRQVDEFYNNVDERFYLMSTYANRVNKAAKSNPGISLSSIVSKKFAKEAEYDKDVAAALMELAVKCASEPESSNQRPTMGKIVHKLSPLHVVQNHLNEISR